MGVRWASEDYELIYMIHQHSEEALDLLLRRYERVYKAIAFSFQYHFKDTSERFDLCLQCRFVLYLATLSFREDKGTEFSFYFKLLAQQAAINEVRRINCKQRIPKQESVSADMYVNEAQSVYLIDTLENNHCEYDPLWCFELQELQQTFYDELKKLPIFEQAVWEYKFYGYSYKQISTNLNVSIKKVDNTIQKLKQFNQKIMQRHDKLS
ncbi:MAG: hypothetical protein RSF69_02345 [Erysipelotrichaceae bacterium]